MLTIYKYSLEPGLNRLNMPAGARPLTAREQNGQMQMWALVDPYASLVPREILVVGTGHGIPDFIEERALVHIGTVDIYDLIFHVFEVTWRKDQFKTSDDPQGDRA